MCWILFFLSSVSESKWQKQTHKKLPKNTAPKTCDKNLMPKDLSVKKNIDRAKAVKDEDDLIDLASKPFDDSDLLE